MQIHYKVKKEVNNRIKVSNFYIEKILKVNTLTLYSFKKVFYKELIKNIAVACYFMLKIDIILHYIIYQLLNINQVEVLFTDFL